jgi:hypothetical protein
MAKRNVGFTLDRVLDEIRELQYYGKSALREAQETAGYDNDPMHSLLKIQSELETIRDDYYTVDFEARKYSTTIKDTGNYPAGLVQWEIDQL